MKHKQIYLYSGLTLIFVAVLSILWEFWLAQPGIVSLGLGQFHPEETTFEKWESVIVIVGLTAAALVPPVWFSIKAVDIGQKTSRALDQSEERYSLAMNGINEVVWDWDIGADKIYFSDRLEDLFGFDPAEFSHPGAWTDRISPDDVGEFRSALTAHLKGETEFYAGEYRITNARGESRWVFHRGLAVRGDDGRAYRMAGSLCDMTDRAERQEGLLHAKEGAESANAAKSIFLSRMSHELRTPLNAILGFSQLLAYNPKEPLSDGQSDSVRYIVESGEHLLKLINEILDLAKIEARNVSISIERVHVSETVAECVTQLQMVAGNSAISIVDHTRDHAAVAVMADGTRLQQVILNLLSNSIKYSPEDSTVVIDCVETEEGLLRLSITDQGTGLTAEQQKDIFQPFNRLGIEDDEIEGTGIGLTISQQLIELMHGSIGCDSRVGHGSTFWIELPLDRTNQTETLAGDGEISAPRGPAKAKNGERTVVYVEDNSANTKLMEEIINRVPNLRMLAAETAEFGLELVAKNRPDIVVMDINLPGMDGFEALHRLRMSKDTQNIPVIALSASALPEDIQKGLEAGFFDYLTKPINVVEVLATIADALETV